MEWRNQRNRQHDDNDPLFIKEAVVKKLLSWNDCVEAMETALQAATRSAQSKIADESFSTQTPRTFTPIENAGVLLTMPGFVGNYVLKSVTGDDVRHSTLACKLVTSFSGNSRLNPPLSNILATILLFDVQTGRVKAIIEGSEITTWRTAAVSLVATKYLYCDRQNSSNKVLAICGTGVQGRIHAIGMLSYFPNMFTKLNLWNRTQSRAESLRDELKNLFPGIEISIHATSVECVRHADVIVTATNSSSALFELKDLKRTEPVHICAIGAGMNHHSEVSMDIYQSASQNQALFIESNIGIQTELSGLRTLINGEIGEVIDGRKSKGKNCGKSVFQSMGNALEDGVMANLIYQKYIKL